MSVRIRITRTSFFLATASLALASQPAAAGPPAPWLCSVPSVVVGNLSGQAIGDGFVVVVRRASGDPYPGADVQLIFPVGGPRPLLEQEPGTTVDCAARSVRRAADGNGVAVFHPRISGHVETNAVEVRAAGLLLRQVSVRSMDLDGSGVVDLIDFHRFAESFLGSPTAAETDFNADGRTDALDFDLFRRDFVARAQGAFCP